MTYFIHIGFIDSMLEVSDINRLTNDELIRHELLTEDDITYNTNHIRY